MIYLQFKRKTLANLTEQQLILNDYTRKSGYGREWPEEIYLRGYKINTTTINFFNKHGYDISKKLECCGIWINYQEKYFYRDYLIHPSNYTNVYDDNTFHRALTLLNVLEPTFMPTEK